VHLKSLTLKGFKSFASATTLRLEPGITCVVGPNGSGKSNVVDAISWVLGEQGAKALRGGKMEDVIFAGTSGRAPLGRAEVTLTIDNSDGALPIDYSEVSITRRMFRDGAGEYEINGDRARLLDVQELLSDSGIGREMHVIVGQGQLDGVLQSKPEDRRAYIEEAAGVLKHRKRKEKALRKLDAMQANLTRLTDLTAELRRQLKPLGRQAEIARRAQAVQSELRDARLRIAADDLVALRDALAREEADEQAARARRAEVEEELRVARETQAELEEALAADAPRLAAAHDVWYRLSALAERLRGTVRLAQERARHLADTAAAERAPGRDPDLLDAEADEIAAEEELLVEGVSEARTRLAEVLEERAEHERTLQAAERAHLAAVRALADRRAGIATLAGRAEALRTGAAATAEEIERLSEALAEAQARTEEAAGELEAARESTGVLDDGDSGPADRLTEAEAARESAAARVAGRVAREREVEQQRAHWRARVDALSVGLARKDGTGALIGSDGVLGAVSGLLTVEPSARTAIAAVLGSLADGVAVASPADAVASLRSLRAGGLRRAAWCLSRPRGRVRGRGAAARRRGRGRHAGGPHRSGALLALGAAEHQQPIAEAEPVDDEPDTEIRDAAADALAHARSEEVEARLALRTAEERARAIAGRAESLRRQASSERQARARAEAARADRERGAAVAGIVIDAGQSALDRIDASLAPAAADRDEIAAARAGREGALAEARTATMRLTGLLEKLTDTVHRDEVLRAQSRLRLEQLTEKGLPDHGLGGDDLVNEHGPDVPAPPPAAETAGYGAGRGRGEDGRAPPPMAVGRAAPGRRLKRAEEGLPLLGKGNPLALEEFAALEERYRFLSTQLEDLKNTRRDLLTVVQEVDDKILEVFAAAYHDVAREFETVFATLFPGGDGRLVLTDPDDLLTTGIEVEARPPGKKVKRLSLLSGGERSLTAMALLVAIFRARPSPFYVLDEIEAALDDVNLRRLISLMEELRATSQLIVITHQKPTMEVADALYGVSMRGDGITTVISQRLRPAS